MSEEKKVIRITCEGAASVPIKTLRNFQGNLKTLESHQYELLRASIEKHGFSFPIAVWRDEKERHIIDGHQRVFVVGKMMKEGFKLERNALPVDWIEADDIVEAKKKVLIASSQYGRYDEDSIYEFIHESGLDFAEMKLEMDLPQINMGTLEQGWFKDEEIDEKADEAPELPKKAITKMGDLWILGDHRLLCGDSTKDIGFIEEKIRLVITDPPYGVDYKGQQVSSGVFVHQKRSKIIGDAGDSAELYHDALKMIIPICDDKAAFYIWYADAMRSVSIMNAVMQAGLRIKAVLIWYKINSGFGSLNQRYKQKHEPILYCSKKDKADTWYGPNNETTVWEIKKEGPNEIHPTKKPIQSILRPMLNSSKEGDAVADMFLGSGTTMIAAEKLNRRCYGIEIEPRYVDVCIERWENYTSKKAKRKKA